MARNGSPRRTNSFAPLAAIIIALMLAVPALGQGGGATHGPQPECTNKHEGNFSGNGANRHGPYDSTCDGRASQNGRGTNGGDGRPCQGCVGNADNKNPPGQEPGPQDPNRGYECDQPGDTPNQGVAEGNPAHSGCAEYPIS
jgi:hypothetical protein